MEKIRAYLKTLSAAEIEDYARRCNTTVGYLRKLASTKTPMGEGMCLRLCVESDFSLKPEDLLPGVSWGRLEKILQSSEQALAA